MQKETYIIAKAQNIKGFASREKARHFLRYGNGTKDAVVIIASVIKSVSANAFLNEPEFEVKPDEINPYRVHSYLLERLNDRRNQPKRRICFKVFDLSDQLLGEADTIEQARELFLNRYKYWVGDCDVFIEETAKV